MAEQRGGEVRNKKTVNLIDVDDGIQTIDHSGGDDSGVGGNTATGLLAGEDAQTISGGIDAADDSGKGTENNWSTFFGSDLGTITSPSSYVPPGDSFRFGSTSNEFGQDTNRLDYFRSTPFNVFGDDNLTGISTHGGGGGGGARSRGIFAGPRLEQEKGNGTAVAGGDTQIRRGPFRFSAYNGDSDGGSSRGSMGGSIPERAGGGDRSRGLPVEIFAKNGSETVVQKLKPEGATVTVPVAVVVAVAAAMMMMMMIMMMAMVMLIVMVVVWCWYR